MLYRLRKPAAFLTAALSMAAVQAQPTSCLVLGAKSARIASSEGEKSPVFVAKDCSSLRLVSGQAQASWVARDGKPRVVPITPQGVAGVPMAGAEERSVNQVWAELTTRRERQQPAYMRSFGSAHAPTVFIPAEGLMLVGSVDSAAQVRIAQDGAQPQQFSVEAGQPVRLTRQALVAGQVYTVQIQRANLVEEWKWRIASESEAARIDEQLAAIDASEIVPEQRGLLQAMLYEQLRLKTNMDLVIQGLRAKGEQPAAQAD